MISLSQIARAFLPLLLIVSPMVSGQPRFDGPPPGHGHGRGSGRGNGRGHRGGGWSNTMEWDTTKSCADDFASNGNDCESFRKCCENLCEPGGQGYQADCVVSSSDEAQLRCTCRGGGMDGASGSGRWHGHSGGSSEDADNSNGPPRYHQYRPQRPRPPPSNVETATFAAPARPSGGNKGCGVPTVQPVARIVGGTEAKPHSWPWQISLQLRGRHLCGGSLISNTHILTAAHCFGLSSSARNYQVVVGMHDKSRVDGTSIGLSRIYVNPDYDEDSNSNDVAVAVLSKAVDFSDSVTPICLAQQDVAAGTSCEVTGWGSTEGTGNNRYLLEVRVPIIDRSTCNDRSHYRGMIDDTMICAGASGKDSCQGDSGGPLVCQRSDGVWEQQGIVSWGADCAQPNRPGVYTRVMKVKSFIEKIMNSS